MFGATHDNISSKRSNIAAANGPVAAQLIFLVSFPMSPSWFPLRDIRGNCVYDKKRDKIAFFPPKLWSGNAGSV